MRGDGQNAPASISGTHEVFASGFQEPSGLVFDRDGSALVTDRRAGTLTRVTPSGARRIILNNLYDPRGIAVAGDAGVFILEGGSRVLRLQPGGIVSVVSASLKQARAIAGGPDGRVFIAVLPDRATAFDVVQLETSGALTRVASGFVDLRALAVGDAGIYAVMESLVGEQRERTTLARLPWRPDGRPGPVQSLLRNTPRQAHGVAVDAAGDVFITGTILDRHDQVTGVVIKRRADGDVSLVASGLSRPGPAAFGPGRDLFVVEHDGPARILRFRAPAAPIADIPSFTNRTPLRVSGTAQRGSLVQIFGTTNGGTLLGAGLADSDTGAFVVSVALIENDRTPLTLVATANRGGGLVGPSATTAVVHDDHLPTVRILEPPAAAYVRDTLTVRAQAADDGSGVATLRVELDQINQAAARSSDGRPLSVAGVIDTARLSEGPHNLTASASDRAGNWSGAAQLIVVDRTPPETLLLDGPPAETPDRSVTFTLGGSDAQAASLEFAWRLDSGAWSPFSASTTVRVTDLAQGLHRFEAAARDHAGNIDGTPAAQAFIVTALTLRITEPASGAAVATETLWVRGTVEGGQDVALRVPLPATLQQELSLDALPVPMEAGTFAVEVPVVPGMTSLTVVGRDSGGAEFSDTVGINVLAPLSRSVRLEAHPPAGLAPHSVRFSTSEFPTGSLYSLDLESDGIADYVGNALTDVEFEYSRPGVHVAELRVVAPDNRVSIAQTAIEVYDRTILESRVRGVWEGFKSALRGSDVVAAAAFVHTDRRAAWTEYFARLTPAQIEATDDMFTDITLRDVAPGRAECDMMRDEGGLLYSFPVSFEIDVDGRWRLWQF